MTKMINEKNNVNVFQFLPEIIKVVIGNAGLNPLEKINGTGPS